MIPKCPKVVKENMGGASGNTASGTPNLGLYTQTLYSTLGLGPSDTFFIEEAKEEDLIAQAEDLVHSPGSPGEHEKCLFLLDKDEENYVYVVTLPRWRHSEQEVVEAKIAELKKFNHFDAYEIVNRPEGVRGRYHY